MIDSMPIELIHLHQDACYIGKTDEKQMKKSKLNYEKNEERKNQLINMFICFVYCKNLSLSLLAKQTNIFCLIIQ